MAIEVIELAASAEPLLSEATAVARLHELHFAVRAASCVTYLVAKVQSTSSSFPAGIATALALVRLAATKRELLLATEAGLGLPHR